ncbi:hypothetical protein [Pseudoblastomonas halimionae]|uniref:CBM-cenC domain-containing protein n=1 Tax=Alteriqipengyuania halimionae TaxID=1926630 RepID=A0A6I4U0W2_9SPHN|nr:hypothetical protein [Alteriqipengyuania halimionae]MXP09518.1 hypothetical protein [Alteriqipengyuania halimionae]
MRSNNLKKVLFAGGAALIAVFAAPSASAQADDLVQLDAQLPGTLVNDPTRIDWVVYGDTSADVVRDETIPGGKAAQQFTIRSNGPIYNIGAKVPLLREVARGDTITIGFYARKLSSDGAVQLRFQRDVEPYQGFGQTMVALNRQWTWHEVTAQADVSLSPEVGIVVFQFGQMPQSIEIGQVIVVTGANAIAAPEAESGQATRTATSSLPPPLQGSGTLLNAPENREWSFSADGGQTEERRENDIWLGRATRFLIDESLAEGSAHISRVPIEGAINAGDRLLFAIAARDLNEAGDGAYVGATLIDKQTGSPLAEPRYVKFAGKWQLGRIQFESPRDIDAGTAELALIFPDSGDRIDVGPVYVLRQN